MDSPPEAGGHRRAAESRWWRPRVVLVAAAVLVVVGTPVLVPLILTRQDGTVPTPTAYPTEALGSSTGPAPGSVLPEPGAGIDAGAVRPTRAPTATPTPTPTPVRSTPVPASRANLVVTGIDWVPAGPKAGYSVTFRATVRNAGTAPAPAGGLLFRVDGVVVSWSRSDASVLAPGAVRTYTADGGPTGGTWSATAGRHTVLATVDSAGRVAETAETDNTATATLKIPGRTR